MPSQETNQGLKEHFQPAIASPFFRVYSGSGLTIHPLARRQPTPNLAKVARTVSPLTWWGVSPCSKPTSATKGRVQRLVGLPKARGLW